MPVGCCAAGLPPGCGGMPQVAGPGTGKSGRYRVRPMLRLPERLTTPRLALRPPVLADADALFAGYCQDPAVCRYMVWTPHAAVTETRDFLAACVAGWASGSPLTWVLAEGDGPPIGMIEARPGDTRVSIGYVLARAHWGKGLMPEAIRAVTDASLALPAVWRVDALVDTGNVGSARALEKAGFAREARLARYGVHPNVSPEPRDVYMYARVR